MKITLAKTLVAGVAAAALLGSLPSVQAADGKTRAQVRAEYDEAVRTGDIVDPVTVQKLKDLYPAAYPQNEAGAAGASAKTRSDVVRSEKQDAGTKAN